MKEECKGTSHRSGGELKRGGGQSKKKKRPEAERDKTSGTKGVPLETRGDKLNEENCPFNAILPNTNLEGKKRKSQSFIRLVSPP